MSLERRPEKLFATLLARKLAEDVAAELRAIDALDRLLASRNKGHRLPRPGEPEYQGLISRAHP